MTRTRRLIAALILLILVTSIGCVSKAPPENAPTPPQEGEQT